MTADVSSPKESYGDFVDRLFKKVMNHMNWTKEKTSLWFRTKNPHLGGCTPDDLLSVRPRKLEGWINAMVDEHKRIER